MRFFRDVPIKQKLIIITMFTTALALALACIAFTIYDQVVLRRDIEKNLSVTAEMIGLNSASALSFNDPASATQTLKSLGAHPQIVAARVYDRDGAAFATYHRPNSKSQAVPEISSAEGVTSHRREMTLVRKIVFDGEVIGTIYLGCDLKELQERLALSALVFIIIILGAGLIAYAVVSRLQQMISEPVSQLAAVAGRVATENDYSVRAVKHGNDEVGALIDGFNEMLGRIQVRDADLQKAHDQLETRVVERTRELASSVSLLNATLDATTDGIIAANHDLEVVCYNNKFAGMWGLSPEMLARRDTTEMIAFGAAQTRDPDQFTRIIMESTKAESHSVDVIELKDGRTFERYIHPQRIDGRDVGVVFSYRDVTERKQAQEQAAREKARLQFIFESVPVGISLRLVRPDSAPVRLINDSHVRISGVSRAQVDDPDIFRRMTHPEDHIRETPLSQQLAARASMGYAIDKRYVHADGKLVWATFTVQRHNYPDGSYEELSTIVDITALKEAQEHVAREEARLKFIFDSVPVGICLDHLPVGGTRHRVLNEAHLRICGLSREQAQEDAFQRITHPDDLAQQRVLRSQLEAGLTKHFTLEKRYIKPNGEIVWVAYSVQRQRFADGSYQDLSTVVDISEVKRAQVEVARERARFKFIFESVPVGISLVVPGQEETHVVNPAHERITGITAEHLHKPRIFERVTHPEDYLRQRDIVQSYKDGKIDHFSLEKRYLHVDGRVVWVSLTRRMFTDSATGQKQSITTLIDITDLKAAQDEVARERARFKFIFEAVPVGISLVVPGEADSVVVNPAHVSITGVSESESRLPGAFARVSHPDDYRRQLALTDKVVRGEIDHYSLEKRYLHPDGRVVWAVLTNRTFTDPATGSKQSVTTLVEITELKAAQEQTARQQARFKFIFEAVPVGLAWMLNGELPTRIVNPAHARITGVPVERCQDLDLYHEATPAADRERQAELRRRLHAREIEQYEIEKRYIHADGSERWAALSVRCFSDPETREMQEITTLVDVTERKEAEAKLAETHQQLLATSRQAGMAEIATGVLHNVGNVLNSVNVSTTLLSDIVRQSKVAHVIKLGDLLLEQQADLAGFFTTDPRGQRVPSFVQTLSTHLVREQGDLLQELESLRKSVEHIKDIVAMQQNYAKVSGVSETLIVTDLIEDAVRMNATALNRHDVKLVRDFQAQPRVTVDKHKVLQILVNLMRNAKYACDDAQRSDKEMIVRVTSVAGRVTIAVIDNGVGIPPENITRIFSHGFTTRKHGHGFGLHSGALAAKELGGSLTAHSEGHGHGAMFALELPEHVEVAVA